MNVRLWAGTILAAACATAMVACGSGGQHVGDINPGASSAAVALKTASGNFHCTIHSTMIGSFNAAAAPTPPPCTTPGYC